MRVATFRLVSACLAVAAFSALSPAPVRAQAADKPAMHVGDSWAYAQTTDTGKGPSESMWARKVVAVGADGGFDFQIGERVHKYDAAGNYLDPKGAEYNRTVYKFPMQVGSEWSYVAKFGTQVMMDQRGSYKVVAYEPLTVPAGTFDCFKVEGKAEAAYRISYQQQIKETYWYCPKVNGIAKLQRETSTTSRDSPSSREKIESVLTRYTPKG